MAQLPSWSGSTRKISNQERTMPDTDRVPMFHPCYRIHDLVEVRRDNPHYARSLPRIPARNTLRDVASWLRDLMRGGKRPRRNR
jgi:hypothetical protein